MGTSQNRSLLSARSAGGSQQQIIIRSIVALAHSLQLRVAAEGIETQAQLQYLKDLNCQEGQGYFFSKPLPPDAVHSLIVRS